MNHNELSSFGQASVALDRDFSELERLKGQLERLELETDFGLDRAKELLTEFGEAGLRVAQGVQTMAKGLEEARLRAEKSAEVVTVRAHEVQARQEQVSALSLRFQQLADRVRELTAVIGELGRPKTEEEKARLAERLPELDERLGAFAEEAGVLRSDAREARAKTLEKNAEALGQSLTSARRKLGSFIARPDESQQPELH